MQNQSQNFYDRSSGANRAQQLGRMPRGLSMRQGVVSPTQNPQAPPLRLSPNIVRRNYNPCHYYLIQHPSQTGPTRANQVRRNYNPCHYYLVQHPSQTGPTGANQAQPSLTAGSFLTSSLPPTTVIDATAQDVEKQLPTSPMVTAVGASLYTPPGQQGLNRRRKYAIEIIDPNTNKNIFDDMDLSMKTSINKVKSKREKKILSIVAPSDANTSKVSEGNLSEGLQEKTTETSSLQVESSVESTITGELAKIENIECQNINSDDAADNAIIELNDIEETLPEENSHATKDLTTDETDCENNIIVAANIEIVPTTLTETVGDSTETTASDSTPADDASEPTISASIISYKEGQWSPNNPTGKKQYDRDQLMQLRGVGASLLKPDIKVRSILPQSNPSLLKPDIKVRSILPQSNLMPWFVRNKNNSQRVQSVVGDRNRHDAGNGINARGMIHINLSLDNDVQLNVTDNAWRPRVLDQSTDEHDPEVQNQREKDELVRRVRGILNKLTPEKFDTLVEEIVKLKIDTPDKMKDVMTLVFEKAINEPNFSVTYARLCHRLITEAKARDERMESNTRSNLAHFRNALLNKTEAEFTINVTQSSAKEQKLQPILEKIKNSIDSMEIAELKLQLEEEERKIRRRSGGTVRFIGELFKISLITGRIIYSCIEQLLNPNSEDMLECMSKLLTTVGAKLEQTPISNPSKKHAQSRLYSLDKIIARMQAIALKSDGTKISSRVRFMLQDVIDLRKKKWQSTRNEAPKKMQEIKTQVKSQQLRSQCLNYSADGNDRSGPFNESSRSSGGGNSQRTQRSGNQSSGVDADGENKNNACAVDSNKLEGLQNIDRSIKKMGGLSQFQWAMATTTPTKSALSSLKKTAA